MLRQLKTSLLYSCLFLSLLSVSTEVTAQVLLGIDRLERLDFKPLAGKRVGLLTHPAGVNSQGVSTITVLHQDSRVNLVALFGPEHGIYGDEKANIPVLDRIDSKTGLPVYSLYGKYRSPTPEMLSGLDCLVIDLQDLGVRSYTYVSCMRLAMKACFAQGVEVMILDRPNPLGGLKVDGPPLDKHLTSYVGAFRVPYVHGLTIAELARMCKRIPGWLGDKTEDRERQRTGKLTLVPMQGWKRSMMWPDTQLNWVPTSPAIPDISAAMGYAMTGLGTQLGSFSHGYGTRYPFRLISYKGKTAYEVAQALNMHNIAGLEFREHRFRDTDGRLREGAFVIVKDWERLRPTEVSFHMMRLAAQWDKEENPFAAASDSQALLFNKHTGSQAWWIELSSRGNRARVEQFTREWQKRAQLFQKSSKQYWLYQE